MATWSKSKNRRNKHAQLIIQYWTIYTVSNVDYITDNEKKTILLKRLILMFFKKKIYSINIYLFIYFT